MDKEGIGILVMISSCIIGLYLLWSICSIGKYKINENIYDFSIKSFHDGNVSVIVYDCSNAPTGNGTFYTNVYECERMTIYDDREECGLVYGSNHWYCDIEADRWWE